MADKTYKIDLSLGFKTFEIRFKEFEEPVYIQFNPADEDLSKRLIEAGKKIKEQLADFEKKEYDEEYDETDSDEVLEEKKRINQIIYDAVDYAFGNKISDKLFIHCSPLARTNGNYFIMQFFEKITPVIQQINDAENKKAEEHTEKYFSKYRKK